MFTRFGLLLFTTGFCALVYQVTWLRMLRHVFGGSTASTAAVLAIFMGGLGLGGALIGRRAGKMGNPLELYAKLEIGIALSAAASPWLVDLARYGYFSVAGIAPPGTWASMAVRLLLSALVLLIPTTLMGATLPAVAHALERADDPSRRRTALYYGLNSAGAVLGTLATTFFLIELLGIRNCLLLAAAVNLLAAMTARHLARRLDEAPVPAPAEAMPVDAVPARRPGRPQLRVILATSFGVGFVFFLMEIVWYRMLAPILGGSSYTFGLILAMALLGIALGGLLFSRRPADLPPRFSALALTCALEGLCLVLPLVLGDRLAVFAAATRGLSVLGFAGLALGWAMVAAVVVLPTAIVAGYQFPLLIALLGGGRDEVAPEVGAAAACNTFGAIAGSLAGGFGLLPLIGAVALWRFDVWLLCALAIALAIVGRRDLTRRRAALVAAVVVAAAGAAFLAKGPSGIWRDWGIGAGRFDMPSTSVELRAREHLLRTGTVEARDGVETHFAAIAIEEMGLINNGKSDGSAVADAGTTVMLGLVPAMVHPETREALVIGLGTGATAGWLGAVPSVEHVDAVELEPVVGDMARYFASVNQAALDNPKVKLVIADGRAWLQTSKKQYDVIASEPSNLYRIGVADLFSQDFYQTVAGQLRPKGILAQWLQGYELDSELVRMVSANLRSVFPHVEVWQLLPTDLMFLASAEPIEHDFDRVRRRAAQEPWKSALVKAWRVEPAAESFYSAFVGSTTLATSLAQDVKVSTDDRPLLEFGFARRVGFGGDFSAPALRTAARRLNADQPLPATGAPLDPALVEEARMVRYEVREGPADPAEAEQERWQRHRARREFLRGRTADAARIWVAQPGSPRHPIDFLLLSAALAQAGDARAAELAAQLPSLVDREQVLATLASARGDREAALAHLLACWRAMRTEPFFDERTFAASMLVARSLLKHDVGRASTIFDALAEPFAAHRFEANRLQERLRLSVMLPPERQDCLQVFGALEPYPPWNAEMLTLRHRCYQTQGHPLADQAADDLADVLAGAVATFDDLELPTAGGP